MGFVVSFLIFFRRQRIGSVSARVKQEMEDGKYCNAYFKFLTCTCILQPLGKNNVNFNKQLNYAILHQN